MPASALAEGEDIRHGENVPSRASMTSMEEGSQQQTTDAGGAAEGKTHANEFQQYAAALRAQGHPEKTVRELTASRITAAFQIRRTALRSGAWRGNEEAADIQSELDALGREQGALIVRVLGTEEQPAPEVTAEAVASETLPGGGEGQVLMPAVMAEAMPATVQTGEQAADWEKLRGDFVNAIGGASQDPAAPQYRKRWVQAQSEADRQFRLMFGDNAYVAYQMKAQEEARLRQQGAAGQ